MQEQKETVLSTENLFKNRLNQVLETIREELDDHRQSINENTDEIQSNHEFLLELDQKIEKINERLDELTLLLKGKKEEKTFKINPLTKREKEVFMALYSLSESRNYTTYKELARKLGITENLAASYITNLAEKGVPLIKKYCSGKAYIGLNNDFRQIQAKENIIGLDFPLSHWIPRE